MDQPWPNHQRRGGAQSRSVPVGAFRQGSVPTVERGIISGDNLQFGRLRRRTPLSESSGGPEDEWLGSPMEAGGSYGQSPVLQAEGAWQSHGAYEQGEGNHQRRPYYGAQSSSPRSPGAKAYMSFHSRRINNNQQQEAVSTVKASGTPHRQSSRGRKRTSSENEQGGKGSRGPYPRRRGFSETEGRLRWDNTNMSGLQCLASENIWFDKCRYDEAEKRFYEGANGPSTYQQVKPSLHPQAKGRQPQKRLHRNSSSHAPAADQELIARMKNLELENNSLHKVVEGLKAVLLKLESRVAVLEKSPAAVTVPCAKAAPTKVEHGDDDEEEEDDDDDMDLFGSEEEDEDAERVKQERLEAYAAKKAKKPALIAKSSILLDVKPWDDETDMAKLEECVRSVQMDGLLWGASKLVPVGYGIKKLQINCVVEDEKVGTDILEEEIVKFEDFIQSIDVAAFNKI